MVGDNVSAIAESAANVAGVRRALLVENANLAKPIAEKITDVVAQVQKGKCLSFVKCFFYVTVDN